VALALLLGACQGPAAGSSAVPDPSQSAAAVATEAPCPAAVIEGVLVASDTWGLALGDSDLMIRQVIWPEGYTVSRRPPTTALLDASGTAVAWEGDRVRIGGGETGSDGAWNACGGITVTAASSPTPAAAAPVIECGRIGPAACQTAITLATAAVEPGIVEISSLIVVDDLCPPPALCDRKFPFDSLVVFVTAGADTTGWYPIEVTGLKDDTPTDAKRWDDYLPAHIGKLISASLP
jgi:hypothetical protein